jgi:hypothetical protein
MTRTRAFHRFHRWTARLRRRHLRAWLPEPRETERVNHGCAVDLRQRARVWGELRDLDWLGDANRVQEQPLL